MTNPKPPANPLNNPSSFDEDEYYTTSVDDKGHFKTSHVATPPDIHAMIMGLVGDPNHPYRTVNDVYRDAVIHLLELRLRKQPNPALHWQVKMYRNEEERRQRMERSRLDFLLIENVDLAIKRAKSVGDANLLAQEIKEAEEVIGLLPPGLQQQLREMLLDAEAELVKLKERIERIKSTSNGSRTN